MGFLIMGVVFVSLLLSALFVPYFYTVAVTLFPAFASQPIDGVLSRLVMLVIALVIWRLYPYFRLPGMRLGKLDRKRLPVFLYGLLLGGFAVGCFYTVKIFMGSGFIDANNILRGNLVRTLLTYIIGAVAVAFIEEIFFRGIVYNALKRDGLPRKGAALLAAAFFGSMHFVDFAWLIDWQAGKASLRDVPFSPQLVLASNWVQFFLLMALGLLLIYIYEKCANLWASIGLHAGMVFSVRLADKITFAYPGQSMSVFSFNLADIGLVSVVLLITALLIGSTSYKVSLKD